MRPTTDLIHPANHVRRDSDSATPEVLSRDAYRLLAKCGIERSRQWVSRTVRDYASSIAGTGFPFGAYLLNRVELNAEQRRAAMTHSETAYLLEYADPTGETAVRNVLTGARRG